MRRDDLVGHYRKTGLPPLGAWFHLALVFKARTASGGTFRTYISQEDTHMNVDRHIVDVKDVNLDLYRAAMQFQYGDHPDRPHY